MSASRKYYKSLIKFFHSTGEIHQKSRSSSKVFPKSMKLLIVFNAQAVNTSISVTCTQQSSVFDLSFVSFFLPLNWSFSFNKTYFISYDNTRSKPSFNKARLSQMMHHWSVDRSPTPNRYEVNKWWALVSNLLMLLRYIYHNLSIPHTEHVTWVNNLSG